MNEFHPLLAVRVEDLIPVLVMILFLVIGAVSQVLNRMRQAQQQQPPRVPDRPKPPFPPAGPQRRQGPLAQEIDEFLRRAGAGPATPPRPRRPVRAEVVQPEVIGEDEARGRLAEHHLRTMESRLPASDLGEGVVAAEDRLQEHFQQTFDHKIGRLAFGMSAAAAAAPQVKSSQPAVPSQLTAMDLASLLTTPAGLRQAILLNEILVRPEHRWE